MDLFFHQDFHDKTTDIVFEGEEFHHIVNVMRYNIGDEIFITNGLGLVGRATIRKITKTNCICEIVEVNNYEKNLPRIHALIPILKQPERFEYAIEKLTELGVDEIQPFLSERSVKKGFRKERALKIIKSAIKQSFNPFIPKINDPVEFQTYIDSINAESPILYGHKNGLLISELVNVIDFIKKSRIIITVGPEGDFSEQELELLKSKNSFPINLGKNRLRSETAIICLFAQLHLLKFH